MTTLSDLGVSAGINITSALVFLLFFAILRLQPINDRVYFPKWYIKGIRSKQDRGHSISALLNLNWRGYLHFLDWTKEALKMPEPELIDHAGFDSAVYLRIYLLGLRMFIPMFILAAVILFPINETDNELEDTNKFLFSDVDKLSISNVKDGSKRLWAHICMSYLFTAWICGVLYKEYEKVMLMRLRFNDSQYRRPDHFTVLVKNIPKDPDESVSLHIEHFFRVNHPDYYLLHQIVRNGNKLTHLVNKRKKLRNWLDFYHIKNLKNLEIRSTMKKGFLGLWGQQVDAVEYYTKEIENVTKEVINVYDQRYESAGAFWPSLHTRIIACLIIQQISFLGLLATKKAESSTPILVVLPVLTYTFHVYCKSRFEPAFSRYPLEEAMAKDTLERAVERNLNLKSYLQDTYMHPIFKEAEVDGSSSDDDESDFPKDPPLVPLKWMPQGNTPGSSVTSELHKAVQTWDR